MLLTFLLNPILNSTVEVKVPERPLAPNSVHVSYCQPYEKWSSEDHGQTYDLLQKIAKVWSAHKISKEYLVYGSQKFRKPMAPFQWEIVPFQPSAFRIFSFWQQFLVIWKIAFGSSKVSEEELQIRNEQLSSLLQSPRVPLFEEKKKKEIEDAFCRHSVIEKQSVLEGKKVRVLYNYAPIGFGGERLHFLVVPKEHRTDFNEVTRAEYVETANIAQKLISHFSATRRLEEVYLFHKTGKGAGQTVPHWHVHVVFTSNKTQDLLGKLTVLKNMIFGSSPLNDKALKEKVDSLKKELS